MARMIMSFLCGLYHIRCFCLEKAVSPKLTCTCRGPRPAPGLCHLRYKVKEGISGKVLERSCTCTLKSHMGFNRYFREMFLEGKSFTTCHLPTVNKFWKNIWLNHVEKIAGQINRNNFTFLPSMGCLCHCLP